ncbi:MAG: TlpA family protein disulfide reductase [Acidimicrobiia bacterium]
MHPVEEMTEEQLPETMPGGRRRWSLTVRTLVAVTVALIGVIVLTVVSTRSDDQGTNLPGAAPDSQTAPNFSVELLDGSNFSLTRHLEDDGRPVFLNLWASWCLPCRVEMPAIDEAARLHPKVLFLGVAVDDDPVAAEEFALEIGVAFPLGIDESGVVAARYPSLGLPATFLISSDGEIVRRIFGQIADDQIDALIAEHFGS